MNGFMRAGAAAVALGGMIATGGTGGPGAGERYKNWVDTCWPERYGKAARDMTLAPFESQAANGAILDATVWNYHFEPGSDKLVPAGMEKLDYLVRRRPAAPGLVYLQTARDIGYDAATPEKYADTRRDLDVRRAESVQKYLAAQTAARPTSFEVQVLDPANPGFGAQYPVNAIRALPTQYQATISGGRGISGGGGR